MGEKEKKRGTTISSELLQVHLSAGPPGESDRLPYRDPKFGFDKT
jgi:hypothetical protein